MSTVLEGVIVPAPPIVPPAPAPVTAISLGGPGAPTAPDGVEAVRVAIRADLAVSSPEGHILDAVSFVFQQRVTRDPFVTVVGVDSTRCLQVTLEFRKDLSAGTMNISYRLDRARRPVHARDLYPLMRFLARLKPANRVGVVINHKAVAENPVPEGYGSEVPPESVELLRRLAYVQDVTGVDFPVPDEFTPLDIASLLEAERLLNGEVLTGEWSSAELDSLSDEVLDILTGGAALVELDVDVSVTVAGHPIPLGTLTHTFATVRLLNREEVQASRGSEQSAAAHLAPAQDSTYTRRLIDPPSRPPGDPFAQVALVDASALLALAVTTLGHGD